LLGSDLQASNKESFNYTLGLRIGIAVSHWESSYSTTWQQGAPSKGMTIKYACSHEMSLEDKLQVKGRDVLEQNKGHTVQLD